ncbi:helix-turn-helix domain-containing protein [Bradyrhizobium sp. AS23.2]|uniref:IclR family transcriptional regulator n=1 Tax=Bradyrhizobium sp. AS23.2 TaxID=1680155 RepID=UPI00093B2150|nr:helix-turn-helix domain-containing protein [Bradyrhizobium sp. AS23.2]
MSVEMSEASIEVPVVKSAVRTLQILELFDEIKAPLNVVTVSEALGYPQSSTAALLRSLVAMGYLHYDAHARTFVSTDRVSLLGNWINPALFEQGKLTRMMRSVAQSTGQMVLLAARNGDFAQYIHVLNAPENVPHHIGLGVKRPLATSGVGLILLSSMQDAEVRRLFHRMNAYSRAPQDKINIAELIAKLRDIRSAEYTSSRNRVLSGFGVIAMAIPRECSNRPLAIGICGACDVLDKNENEFVSALREEMIHYFGSDGNTTVRQQTRKGSLEDVEQRSAVIHAA